jgi:hypothetical protein
VSTRPPRRPERSEIPPDELDDYDYVLARLARLTEEYRTYGPGEYHGALLHCPPMAAGLNRLGAIARTASRRGSYTDAERELADIVLSVDFGYNGVLPIHLPDMFAVGVRPEAIDAIRAGRADRLTDDESQLVAYIREVSRGEVTDDSFQAIVDRFGLRGAVDYTAFVGFLVCTMRLWSALGVRSPSDAEIDSIIADLREGRARIPHPEVHLG